MVKSTANQKQQGGGGNIISNNNFGHFVLLVQ